ncbi:hypothetical protein [Chelativorans sp. YIM 93263]|uniref:hypothetical protein n=1 Tax=Chelativorans sp. YIM 93263 TaxID=2906648 RepID=UPI0023783E3D|nr:hypothetical protein [Chelativorans sp. YIM 93263]
MKPKIATGKDVYARFGRKGRPYDLTLNPPLEEGYEPPALEEILRQSRIEAQPKIPDRADKRRK